MKTIKAKSKTTKTASKALAAKAPAVKAVSAKAATKAPAAVRAPKRSPKATAAMAAEPTTAALRREITSDLIAARAYIIWEQQGCPQGHDVANWLLAENQLKQEIQSFTA